MRLHSVVIRDTFTLDLLHCSCAMEQGRNILQLGTCSAERSLKAAKLVSALCYESRLMRPLFERKEIPDGCA